MSKKLFLFALPLFALCSCGGGGGASSPVTSSKPVESVSVEESSEDESSEEESSSEEHPAPETGYAVVINGVDYFALTKNDSPLDPSFDEYFVKGVSIDAEQTVECYNADAEGGPATWTIKTVDAASKGTWDATGDKLVCKEAGEFDIYFKFKYEQDQIYFGEHAAE